MATDNTVALIGNLTDDPELRVTPNGAAVANFRLAVTPRIRQGDQWTDGETSFFRLNCWRALAENVAETSPRARGPSSLAGCACGPGRLPRGTSGLWSRSRPTRSPPR
jgi:single-stranded DNA-binding protein